MAFLGESINVDRIPQAESFSLIPDGWYTATIEKAELKTTRAGDGQYISACFKIAGPTHSGRTMYANFNIKNKSQKAEEIGRQQVAQLLLAIGLKALTDTDELLGFGCKIKIATDENEKFGTQNIIKGYQSPTGSKLPTPETKKPIIDSASPPWLA